MLVSIAIRLRVDCKLCGDGIAVNQFVHSAKCARCSGGRSLKWKSLLHDVVARIDTVAMGTHDRAGGPAFAWQHADFWKRPAGCPSCKRVVVREEVEPALAGGVLVCACGTATKIRRPPKDLAELYPRIVAIYGEVERVWRAASEAASDASVVPCRSCGAPLALGSERRVECSFCQAENVLGDALWSRLRPAAHAPREPQEPQLWYMLLDSP
jgi:LSD1 subclass zinc finger protein